MASTTSLHLLRHEVDLSKFNVGIKLVPEFNGKNWQEFKRKLETQYTIMGIHSYLQHHPRANSPVELRNDELAKAQICLRLTQSQFKQVSTCMHTKDVWAKLTNIYEETAESRTSTLFLKFIRHQKKPSQSMKCYLDSIIELYHDLQVYGVNIGEAALCTKALDGLPETYSQIKAAARATGVHTIAKLTNTLLSSDNNMEPKGTDIRGLHTVMKHQRRFSHEQATHNNRKHCVRCKTGRHSSEECWILHPHLKPNHGNRRRNRQNRHGGHNMQAHATEQSATIVEPEQTEYNGTMVSTLCPNTSNTKKTS